jgi:hypothetical protein
MTQTVEQVIQHPWVTVITSWLGSGLICAVVAGIYNLRAKQKEYVNDYYKEVIKRRIAAYEQLEQLIMWLKSTVVDDDNRPYHVLFSSNTEEDWRRVFQVVFQTNGLWLSEEAFSKAGEFAVLIYSLDDPANIIEFGKAHYQTIATIRADLERILARDMLNLHDVASFLKSKNKPDPGFRVVKLKKSFRPQDLPLSHQK